jgi:pyridinium-3,5-bisthiocarboxylic acid mononucleotide nickel chelatase
MVQSAHGVFPVPAPATVRLLGETPVYSGAVQKELVTPTGALIATTYASSFGPIPAMKVERVGYGAGDRDDPVTPNVLRVLIGEEQAAVKGGATTGANDVAQAFRPARGAGDRVTVIECEIDDMNPQIFGLVMDRLYAAGALEVFYIPVQMKKNRPGTLLTVVAPPALRAAMTDVVFRETTTIGLRHYEVERECLERAIVEVETPVGMVRIKVASRDGRVMNATPEFEDCARLAAAGNLPVKDVQALAMKAYRP